MCFKVFLNAESETDSGVGMAKEKKIESIEDLPGVGETTAEKLNEAGYRTLEKIAVSSPSELNEIANLGEGTAAKIIQAARDSLEMGFETADKIMERRAKIGKISTGSKELDALLGGGVETQSVTEAYGRFASSKTQLGFQLAVNVQLPKDKGGLDGNCLFIDSEATFRPDRITAIARGLGLDENETLKRIFVSRAYNSDHQILLIDKAEDLISQNNIKLIIIDSLTSHFRADYIGRGTLAERQQKLNKHLHMLQKWADLYNLAIYITNQVMENPAILFGDPTTPIGGNVLAHFSTHRLYLRRGKESKRVARLVDSPCLPEGEAIFQITAEGIKDI